MVTENEGWGAQVVRSSGMADEGHTGTTGWAVDKGHMGTTGWVTLTMDKGAAGHSNNKKTGGTGQ